MPQAPAERYEILAELGRGGMGVAEAVEHAHQSGIVHRDLEPANVLVDGMGGPHVAEFGPAKEVDSQAEGLTRSGAAMGAPQYRSPEQVLGPRPGFGPGYSFLRVPFRPPGLGGVNPKSLSRTLRRP